MVIGIDLGGTNVRIGRVETGVVIEKIIKQSPSDMTLDESLEYLKEAILSALSADVKGIGIGVPSVVDVDRGIVYNVANIPSWKEVHLKNILEREFGVPVWVNNDANCFAIGEKRFGHGVNYDNLVGITLGTGTGAGVVIKGELYNGANAGAGEIGTIPYLDGVYETYCSGNFFEMQGITAREAALMAKNNDPSALEMWSEFGGHIGKLIQMVMFAYDPNAIIFGGGISGAYNLFFESMMESLTEFPYPESLKNLTIALSDNPDIAILGAAALVNPKTI